MYYLIIRLSIEFCLILKYVKMSKNREYTNEIYLLVIFGY